MRSSASSLRACVVGSGPAGMYTTKFLLKRVPNIHVDVLEALPVPFGLARFGVAPDHPEVKNCTKDFEDVFQEHPNRTQFMGNTSVDSKTFHELKKAYDVVILAHGARTERSLGIPGEDAPQVLGAKSLVEYYNGYPMNPSALARVEKALKSPQKIKRVVVVGHGNVSLDVARMLAGPLESIATTDISARFLETLKQGSEIQDVTVIGRRGPVQGSFTIKELRELTKLEGVVLRTFPEDFARETEASKAELESNRAKTRIQTLLQQQQKHGTANLDELAGKKRVDLRYHLRPIRFHVDPVSGRLTGLACEETRLEGPAHRQTDVGTGVERLLECDLVVRSIGYKIESIDPSSLPILRNALVTDAHGRVQGQPDVYATGWARRGGSGVIATNVDDARQVVEAVAEDLGARGEAKVKTEMSFPDAVSWTQCEALLREEERLGSLAVPAKPRVKFESVTKMLDWMRGSGAA